MTPSVTCYPQPGKAASSMILTAFAAGAKGVLKATPSSVLQPGAAAFYGLVGIEHLLRLAIAESRDWYYGDNGYFDATRSKFYRFTKGWFQVVAPTVAPDYAKAKVLGLEPQPWKKDGRHIVVVEQSEHFLNLSGAKRGWLLNVLAEIGRHTDRHVRVRRWTRDKAKAAATLHADLRGAWALVTHMSAAANEALLAGVPVFTSGRCAATPLASGELSSIERPRYPDGREEWAARLVASQWTIDEIRSGIAWRKLNG